MTKTQLILPDQKELKSLFDYDPETGILLRRTNIGGNQPGSPVGSLTSAGYLRVGIKGKQYKVHRIIWKIMTGDDPKDLDIDHINRNKTDNRFCNLRLVCRAKNKLNHGGYKRQDTNLPTGIYWYSERNRYKVYGCKKSKNIYLGSCKNLCDAIALRRAWDAR